MRPVLETNFLLPNGTFLVELLAFLVFFAGLFVWPLLETVVRRRWGYTLGVVLFGPIGGLLWFLVGRREAPSQQQRGDTTVLR